MLEVTATQRTDGRRKASFRLRTPNKVAGCLKHLAEVNWDFVMECPTPAEAFEKFYTFINAVFDLYFPIRHIVVKDKDPSYMTPVIKYLLRKRNNMLRRKRGEAAAALTKRINTMITRCNSTSLERFQRGTRELWSEVNWIRGVGRSTAPPTDSNVTAEIPESLNQYFGGISQDAHHTPPLCKSTAVDGGY